MGALKSLRLGKNGRITLTDGQGRYRHFYWFTQGNYTYLTISGYGYQRRHETLQSEKYLYLHFHLIVNGWSGEWYPVKESACLEPSSLANQRTPDRRPVLGPGMAR